MSKYPKILPGVRTITGLDLQGAILENQKQTAPQPKSLTYSPPKKTARTRSCTLQARADISGQKSDLNLRGLINE
ncbi:hypothetical protein [Roseofilum casamattae]|uniref:Uncharacterized protein n=1 Tax=Roseofilum casamattae BLCC-M143 TaxID=3022442 RepID=A0ABT7BWH9_9CYAN|nr:hypothetical protein [Roseofilum casamattae]MDJ1183526.1 hypothetical protein [Roseofilum casamattae BLCC-M143]